MQVQIRFVRNGSNTMLGNFSSGDRARVSAGMAHHLVCEARVARYEQMPVDEPQIAQRKRRTRTA